MAKLDARANWSRTNWSNGGLALPIFSQKVNPAQNTNQGSPSRCLRVLGYRTCSYLFHLSFQFMFVRITGRLFLSLGSKQQFILPLIETAIASGKIVAKSTYAPWQTSCSGSNIKFLQPLFAYLEENKDAESRDLDGRFCLLRSMLMQLHPPASPEVTKLGHR